jgi:hypothetical protein
MNIYPEKERGSDGLFNRKGTQRTEKSQMGTAFLQE